MKKIISLLFVVFGLAVLSACNNTSSTTGTSGTNTTTPIAGHTYHFDQTAIPTTTITVWLDDTDGNWANEMITEFNKIHPEIIVNFQHMSTVDAEQNLLMFGPSGNGADIFQFPHDHLATALESDLLWALPTQFADGLRERMLPVAMDIATACYNNATQSFECEGGVTEEVFGAPLSMESVALFYNKALLKEIEGDDYEVVTTFEELITKSETYNDRNLNKYYFLTTYDDSYFMNFAYTAFGFMPFGENLDDKDNPGINSPEVIRALTWIRDELEPLYADGSTAAGIEALTNKFETGDLPYIITGPWMIETYKNLGLDFGVTTIPTINIDGTDVAPKPFAGAQMVGIYKYSRNKDAAQKFLDFMVSDKGLEIMYRVKGKLPALKDNLLVNVSNDLVTDPYLAGIREQLKNTIPMPTIPAIQSYWEPVRIMMANVWDEDMDPTAAALEGENSYFADLNR